MASIISEKINSVLILKLNRPEKFNSFNREMALLLQKYLDEAVTDASIRAVMITGTGKAFCAGQDLTEAVDATGPGIDKIVFEHYNPIIKKIRAIEKPVIACINGVAAGAGANIALACDIIIASGDSSFIQAFSKIGLIPDSGGTFFLPRHLGFHRASALMMTGDKLPAEEAERCGIIYKIYPSAELESAGIKLAEQMAAMPTTALGLTKRLLNETYNNTLDEQLEAEGNMQIKAAATADYQEGVKSFIEKRKPEFTGN